METKIKWGIIGLGKIAHKFAADLMLVENAVLYGVASRSEEKAKDFAENYNATKYFSSYEELVKDPEIDVVYIATPHVHHFENTMLCLHHDKGVLCEKPMGMNAHEVMMMREKAKVKNLFLMEGIWTRFIPATEKLIELLDQNSIGDLLFIHADFGFKATVDLQGRLYNKKLGGGALLDIGLYPLYLSLLVVGIPDSIKAVARMTATEVDSYIAMLLDHQNGAKSVLEATIEADTPTEATIYGSKGMLKLHSRFHQSEKISWFDDTGLKEIFELKKTGNGYVHEIQEVHYCLLNKQTESSKLPLQTSVDLITLIDQVKKQIGLSYDS